MESKMVFHLVLFEQGPPCMTDFCDLFFRFSKTVEMFGTILCSACLEEMSSSGVILMTFLKPANSLLLHAKILIS